MKVQASDTDPQTLLQEAASHRPPSVRAPPGIAAATSSSVRDSLPAPPPGIASLPTAERLWTKLLKTLLFIRRL